MEFINQIMNWYTTGSLPAKIALTVIVLAFGLVIGIPLLSHFVRKSKGKVQIKLNKLNYSFGDTVSGRLIVESPKYQPCERITIELSCRQRTANSRSTSTRNLLLYENKEIVSQGVGLSAGTQEFDFQIKAPDRAPRAQGVNLDALAPQLNKFFQPGSHNLQWDLTANVELEGLDIYGQDRIYFREAEEQGSSSIPANELPGNVLKPKTLIKGVCFLILSSIAFFSGFAALGTFIFSSSQNSFLERAALSEGKVTSVSRLEVRKRQSTDSNRRNTSVRYDYILTIFFKTGKGDAVSAKVNDGTTTVYAQGDAVKILYDPQNPTKIMLYDDKDNANISRLVCKVTAIVFIISIVLIVFLTRVNFKNTSASQNSNTKFNHEFSSQLRKY